MNTRLGIDIIFFAIYYVEINLHYKATNSFLACYLSRKAYEYNILYITYGM